MRTFDNTMERAADLGAMIHGFPAEDAQVAFLRTDTGGWQAGIQRVNHTPDGCMINVDGLPDSGIVGEGSTIAEALHALVRDLERVLTRRGG